jgi:hypothetical protein
VKTITFLKIIIVLFILSLILSVKSYAQFTPAQNAYLNKNELLKNPDAENGVINWVSAIKLFTSTDYFSGASSFEVTAVNQVISICQSNDTTKKLQNALIGSSCRIKTTNPNIQICNVVNGVSSDCAPVSATGSYELSKPLNPFIAGTSTSGVCIESTIPVSTVLRFDNCSLEEVELATGGGGSGNAPYNSSNLTLTGGSTLALSATETNQIILVQGNSGPIMLNELPFGSGSVVNGTQIRIIGNHSDNTVGLTSNDISKGCILNGDAVIGKFDVITLIYNQSLDRYIESSRNF